MKPHQPNRKTVKHYHEPGHLHELTFSCFRRLPLLTNEEWRWQLARCLDDAGKRESLSLTAFVFMPDHVHLLVVAETDNPSIDRYLARVKQPFAKHIRSVLEASRSPLLKQLTIRERPGKHCFRFWQEGPGYDRNLFEPSTIRASLDYIHENPVKRGLCRRAVDWKWSSALHYHAESAEVACKELPSIHGLPWGTLD